MKTISISEAKSHLGKIADEVLRGETVLIVRKSELLILHKYQLPEPIPIRPIGYFDEEDTPDEIALMNLAASEAPQVLLP